MEKIKVILSDPQILFREGIHFILSGEDDFEVTGETTSNDEAIGLIETNPPNIAVLSLQDVKTDGCEATRRIKRNFPSVAVILIMDKKEDEILFQALKCGVGACLTKDTQPEYLLDIIRIVAQGSLPIIDELLNSGVANITLGEFRNVAAFNEEVENLLAGLTPKESQILSAIAAGSTMEQVIAKLDTNEETVRRNLRMVQNKLISNDQTRAVFEAAQRNLPMFIRSKVGKEASGGPYITRAEFNEFKESLIARFKSLINEKS